MKSGSERRQRVALGDELEREPVVAPALSGRARTVVEHGALMSATPHAVIFSTRDDQPVVAVGAHTPGDRLVEAGPPGAAVELRPGVEQRQLAGGADEGAAALFLVERAREGALRPLFEQHRIRLRREQLAPLGLGLLELVDPGVRLLRHGVAPSYRRVRRQGTAFTPSRTGGPERPSRVHSRYGNAG